MPPRIQRRFVPPTQPPLRPRLRQPAVELLAGDIAVLDHRAAEGAPRDGRHQQVDRDPRGEEGDQYRRHVPAGEAADGGWRSEERREGKGGGGTFSTRWSPYT